MKKVIFDRSIRRVFCPFYEKITKSYPRMLLMKIRFHFDRSFNLVIEIALLTVEI